MSFPSPAGNTASPVSGGICPSLQHDGGGLRPASSVETKWAEETGPAVLITNCTSELHWKKNRKKKCHNKRRLDWPTNWRHREKTTSTQFHCHGWEPVLELQDNDKPNHGHTSVDLWGARQWQRPLRCYAQIGWTKLLGRLLVQLWLCAGVVCKQ